MTSDARPSRTGTARSPPSNPVVLRRPVSSYARRNATRARNTKRRMRHSPYHQPPTQLRSNSASPAIQRKICLRPQTAPLLRSPLFNALMQQQSGITAHPGLESNAAASASNPADASEPGQPLEANDARENLRVYVMVNGFEGRWFPGTIRQVTRSILDPQDVELSLELDRGDFMHEIPLSRVRTQPEDSPAARIVQALAESSKASKPLTPKSRLRRRKTVKTQRQRSHGAQKKDRRPSTAPSRAQQRPKTVIAARATKARIQKEIDRRQDYINKICLCDAVSRNAEYEVEKVLESKIDPNFRSDVEATGAAPLHLACRHGYHIITQQLLEAKADPGFKDEEGVNAVLMAARVGDAQTVSQLLIYSNRFLIDSTLPDGRTAIFLATQHGFNELFNMLLNAKCNPTIEDDEGRTPLKMSENNDNENMIRKLNLAIGKHQSKIHLKRIQHGDSPDKSEVKQEAAEEARWVPEEYNFQTHGGFEPVVEPYQVAMPFREFSVHGAKPVTDTKPNSIFRQPSRVRSSTCTF